VLATRCRLTGKRALWLIDERLRTMLTLLAAALALTADTAVPSVRSLVSSQPSAWNGTFQSDGGKSVPARLCTSPSLFRYLLSGSGKPRLEGHCLYSVTSNRDANTATRACAERDEKAQIESKTIESISGDGRHLTQNIYLNLSRSGQHERHQMQFNMIYAGACPIALPNGKQLIRLP
jgi:hypothetical protein